ncbi:uncharacterized protein LOC135107137 [Scylla paramamosain]|uniref:uncharacterized protein LOC135107137 n=1 Tax=Scylla paramamosain TaxID=85552 RepID=UPI00308293A6
MQMIYRKPHTCTTPSHPCTTFREHLWKVSEAVVRNPPCKAAVTFTRPVERHERPQKDELTSVARVERLRVEGNRDWTIHHHVINVLRLCMCCSPPRLANPWWRCTDPPGTRERYTSYIMYN